MSNTDFSELYNFISSRLSNINIKQLFYVGSCYSDCCAEDDYTCEKIADIADTIGAQWGDCGCTKSVFFFKEFPQYVFKIPFRGKCVIEWDDDYDCYCETDKFDEFYYAGADNDNDWDYCETEAWLYHAACEHGVDNFFAGTFYIGEYCGHPIYVSEFRNNYKSTYYDFHNNPSNGVDELCKEYDYIPLAKSDISAMIKFVGIEMVRKLLSFIEEFDINDLHNGNLGTTSDGMVCIIDYSNYNE